MKKNILSTILLSILLTTQVSVSTSCIKKKGGVDQRIKNQSKKKKRKGDTTCPVKDCSILTLPKLLA